MSTEDAQMDAEIDRRIAERFAAAQAAERHEAETLANRLENQRTTRLSELGREGERRLVEGAAERRRQLEERSRRHDEHVARVKPQVDRLVAEIADLDAEQQVARDRAAVELAEIVDPLTRRKLTLAREIARLQEPPADAVSSERPSAGQRLRALVGRC